MLLIVPTFEENGILMLGVVFLFSQFLPIEIIVFDKVFLYPIEDFDFLSSNSKIYLTSEYFCKVFWVWKLSNWPCSGLNYARSEEFLHIADSVTRNIYAWQIIPHNKIVPNWIEASWSDRIYFVRLNISYFDIVQNLKLFNFFFVPQKLIDMNWGIVGTFRAFPWYLSSLFALLISSLIESTQNITSKSLTNCCKYSFVVVSIFCLSLFNTYGKVS